MGVFESSRMRRLTVRDQEETQRGESLFYGNKNGSKFTVGSLTPCIRCNPCGLFSRGRTPEVCDSQDGRTLFSKDLQQTVEQLQATGGMRFSGEVCERIYSQSVLSNSGPVKGS